TYVEIIHPGDRFQFAGDFHPSERGVMDQLPRRSAS
ncbi:histidine utilization repressor, partial [Pseudomonas sp. BGM005]|nr:histidine utilization repressor [Pseudomonas sp. BG5]